MKRSTIPSPAGKPVIYETRQLRREHDGIKVAGGKGPAFKLPLADRFPIGVAVGEEDIAAALVVARCAGAGAAVQIPRKRRLALEFHEPGPVFRTEPEVEELVA